MVFCSVGNITDEKVVRLVNKYLGAAAQNIKSGRKGKTSFYTQATVTKKMDTNQDHCMIGNASFNIKDKRRIGMFLLNNLLGGQALNSRLNLSLRERNGFAYNVESNYNAYLDTGVFSVYFGTDQQNLEKSITITFAELNKLRNTRLGPIQFSKAKNQLKGYLARSYENHESLMLSLGKSLLVFNRIDSLEEICKKIDSLTTSELLEISNEVFEPSKLSTLIYK
jgi:predicted Zn-dependent peptidase